MSHRSLFVLPEDTIDPVLKVIADAKKSLRIKMFIFSEPSLVHAVLDAHGRGVKVQVMLNPFRRNGAELNEITAQQLQNAGVEIKDTNPAFKVSHEKSMVVDDELAFVQSFNWDPQHLRQTRDYGVFTTHAKEVNEIIECFEADWWRTNFNPGETAKLIWCRGNGRTRIAHFIDAAKHHLFVQNDRYQDLVILERLVRAAHRGVKVHIMSPSPHSLKEDKIVEGVGGLRVLNDVGIKIHKLQHLSLHAKLLFADNNAAIIGSINLTTGSFDDRRELAIEVSEKHIIDRLQKVVHHDWKHSHPIDLTDKGLYDDLNNRGEGGAENLVLKLDGKKN